MNIFQPALTIRYKEQQNIVVVQTHSLDGKPHYGKPKEMKHENLPTLLFQLIDADYHIMPGKHNEWEHYREYLAFSPEYVAQTERRVNGVQS